MVSSQVIGFNPTSMRDKLVTFWVDEQNRLLVEYAKKEIVKIGNKISTYHSRHHMDRTGNLLNSLCWGVAYDNKLKDYGFFREAVTRGDSYLHEFFKEREAYLVEGRYLAERFIKNYGRFSGPNRWRVWFAILAPYWGYWEEGFRMASEGKGSKSYGKGIRSFYKFAVMSESYDRVSNELTPAKVKYETKPPEYSPFALKYDFENYQKRTKNQYTYARDDNKRNRK